MTVSYTESCLIWNVPNGAFPHLASSIHQPTIPSGIVILAIDKCTTDVKKIIKKSLRRGSRAATPEVSSTLANSHKPLSGIWLPSFNIAWQPLGKSVRRDKKLQKFRPCAPQSSCFWFSVSRMTDFRSVQILINFLVHFFPQTAQHRFPPVLS